MPPETPQQRRRRLSVISGVTGNSYDFTHMCRRKPERVGIIAEGDSWFAYPRKWLAFGADINIVHHVENKIHGTDTANLLRLASSGDEAVDMTSGKQFKKLYKTLKRNQEWIDIVLFSGGGGNDIVGKNDMLPLLNEYQQGMTSLDCVNGVRFEQKIESILLAYGRLVNLCADVVPQSKIITHTYDIPEPWVYPYLVRRGIPANLHAPILEYMLSSFGGRLIALSNTAPNDERLIVDTQGTLTPGLEDDWLNEIHPTKEGFKAITQKFMPECN